MTWKFHVIGYWYWPLQTVWSWIQNPCDHSKPAAASAVLTKSRVIWCQHVHWCSPLPEFILHCLFIVCYPNQMFNAKCFSSVLSPSMTRSSAVMLSPHQWSMPCPILSHPPIFCFCSPASTPDIISRLDNVLLSEIQIWHTRRTFTILYL